MCVCVGVCMRVPFNRVVVKKPTKAVEDATEHEHVDMAGVSLALLFSCGLWVYGW